MVVSVIAALAVLAAATVIPLTVLDRGRDGAATDASGAEVSLGDVAVYDEDQLSTAHVQTPQTYDQSPPVGGPHYPAWLECGAYENQIPSEYAVHNLEHGTFWFTYRPDDLDEDDVAALAAQLPANGIMSPFPDQDAPVVVTVWGRQLALDGVADPRLPLFLEEFADGTTSPELFASCAGGLTDPDPGLDPDLEA